MKSSKRDPRVDYDENVDYESLEQHTYEEDYVYYTCPRCGGEYLATFIVDGDGEPMCIDCWETQSMSKLFE